MELTVAQRAFPDKVFLGIGEERALGHFRYCVRLLDKPRWNVQLYALDLRSDYIIDPTFQPVATVDAFGPSTTLWISKRRRRRAPAAPRQAPLSRGSSSSKPLQKVEVVCIHLPPLEGHDEAPLQPLEDQGDDHADEASQYGGSTCASDMAHDADVWALLSDSASDDQDLSSLQHRRGRGGGGPGLGGRGRTVRRGVGGRPGAARAPPQLPASRPHVDRSGPYPQVLHSTYGRRKHYLNLSQCKGKTVKDMRAVCGVHKGCTRSHRCNPGVCPLGVLWAWLDAADNFGDEDGLLHQQHEPQYAERAIARRAFFDIGDSVEMWISADGGGRDGEPP